MRSVVNHLIQLQELVLTREELVSIRGDKADTSALDQSISGLAESLEPEAKVIYKRLAPKTHIVISPMHEGRCSACGMSIAIAQVQAIKRGEKIVTCPSCARVLYDPFGAKWIGAKPKHSVEAQKTGISRFSSPDLMVVDLQAKSNEEAIKELACKLQEGHFVDDAEKLTAAAMEREATIGTGIGHGLAFPHVRGIEGGGLSLAMGVSREGIEWSGADSPVKFVFFSTIPTAVSMFYLRLLAGLSESFTKEANRKAALEAKTPEALWKVLVKATRFTVK